MGNPNFKEVRSLISLPASRLDKVRLNLYSWTAFRNLHGKQILPKKLSGKKNDKRSFDLISVEDLVGNFPS